MTVGQLKRWLNALPADQYDRYTVEVGGQYGMGPLVERGVVVNHKEETITFDNDPM